MDVEEEADVADREAAVKAADMVRVVEVHHHIRHVRTAESSL